MLQSERFCVDIWINSLLFWIVSLFCIHCMVSLARYGLLYSCIVLCLALTTSQLYVFLRLVILLLLVRVLHAWPASPGLWMPTGPGLCDGVRDSSSLSGSVPIQSGYYYGNNSSYPASATSRYLHTWFVSCNGSSSVLFHETFLIKCPEYHSISGGVGSPSGYCYWLFFFRGFT